MNLRSIASGIFGICCLVMFVVIPQIALAQGINILAKEAWAIHAMQFPFGRKDSQQMTQTISLVNGVLEIRQSSDKVSFTKDKGMTFQVEPGVTIQRVKISELGQKVSRMPQSSRGSSATFILIHTKGSGNTSIKTWQCQGENTPCQNNELGGTYMDSIKLYFGDVPIGEDAIRGLLALSSK